jgi:hypothetical protein
MTSLLGGGFFFIFTLPVLIVQWIGVVKLTKQGRGADWWCMLSGTILTTLAPFLQILIIFLLEAAYRRLGNRLDVALTSLGVVPLLGSLLFIIGFAIHASRLSRMRGRIEELEMMNLAQATELEKLRNS